MELSAIKDGVTIVGTIGGVGVFFIGLLQYIHANAIRRYEKFHEMSVRFDENDDIQEVCNLLEESGKAGESITRQKKEVFICFLEEIYFMMNSGIMKPRLALYTFGYYAKMAVDSELFWQGLNKAEPFYMHFLEFCAQAKSYLPASAQRASVAY